jgi:branched-chain amino acid transport system permease protein
MSGYLDGLLVILSLNVLLAYAVFLPVATGQLNLGGAAFQAVGAYAAGYLSVSYDVSVGTALLMSAATAGVIAFLLSLLILRTKSVYLVLATFAFAEFVSGVIVNIDVLGGSMGLSVPAHVEGTLVFVTTGITMLIVLLLMQTRFGLAMRALHDDETVAELMGIGVRRVRVAAFTLGGILAGVAGCLHAFYFNFVDIQSFDAANSVFLLLFVLLGGTQTIWGPVVGAIFFTVVPELFRNAIAKLPAIGHAFGLGGQVDTSWRFVLLGVVTVVMMVLRPEGIVTRIGLSRLTSRFVSSPKRRSA